MAVAALCKEPQCRCFTETAFGAASLSVVMLVALAVCLLQEPLFGAGTHTVSGAVALVLTCIVGLLFLQAARPRLFVLFSPSILFGCFAVVLLLALVSDEIAQALRLESARSVALRIDLAVAFGGGVLIAFLVTWRLAGRIPAHWSLDTFRVPARIGRDAVLRFPGLAMPNTIPRALCGEIERLTGNPAALTELLSRLHYAKSVYDREDKALTWGKNHAAEVRRVRLALQLLVLVRRVGPLRRACMALGLVVEAEGRTPNDMNRGRGRLLSPVEGLPALPLFVGLLAALLVATSLGLLSSSFSPSHWDGRAAKNGEVVHCFRMGFLRTPDESLADHKDRVAEAKEDLKQRVQAYYGPGVEVVSSPTVTRSLGQYDFEFTVTFNDVPRWKDHPYGGGVAQGLLRIEEGDAPYMITLMGATILHHAVLGKAGVAVRFADESLFTTMSPLASRVFIVVFNTNYGDATAWKTAVKAALAGGGRCRWQSTTSCSRHAAPLTPRRTR